MPDSPNYNPSPSSPSSPEPPVRAAYPTQPVTIEPEPEVTAPIASSSTGSQTAQAPGSYAAQNVTSYGANRQAAPAHAPAAAYKPPAPAYKPATAPAASATVVRQKGGVGKTFLFGFLGALLACVLVFAAWGIFGGTNAEKSDSLEKTAPRTTLGATSSPSISAGSEDPTLAEQVAAKALPSVVCIYVYADQSSYYGYMGRGQSDSSSLTQTSLGSGIILSEDGYILTNYHVVEGSDALKVNVAGDELEADIVGSDPSSDLAVIKLKNASGLVAADIGDSDNLTVGEWVMTIGSPFGLEQSVATGVVSATSRSQIINNSSSYYGYGASSSPTLYPNMIQTDAAINPGNSGGALVDAQGKVIGVNTLITSYSGNYSGVGFAIPINYAFNIAQQIIEGKTPTHAKLGVSLTTVNAQNAKRYNLPVSSGAYVSTVAADSGAAEAGMREGDIIVSIDGEKMASSTDVTLEIREHNPGDTVKVTVNRDGSEVDLQVTLGSDEEDIAVSMQTEPENGGNAYGYGYGGGNGGMSRDELWEYLFGR